MADNATRHRLFKPALFRQIGVLLANPDLFEIHRKKSYKNFHAKGMDYVCFFHNGATYNKVYFLEEDAAVAPELVNPHDHRYAFRTVCLSGALRDFRFTRDPRGDVFQAFDYRTPLCGGNGFTFRGNEQLLQSHHVDLRPGDELMTSATELHTITARKPNTVIYLEQFKDVVPDYLPTSCWVRKGEPKPDTSGLYEEMDADTFRMRLIQTQQLFDRLPHGR